MIPSYVSLRHYNCTSVLDQAQWYNYRENLKLPVMPLREFGTQKWRLVLRLKGTLAADQSENSYYSCSFGIGIPQPLMLLIFDSTAGATSL